ncbi:MAG: hypothetical protein LRY76_00220 [Alphaproteobacteria bacterium]|nr:hypothetical protein [Alphaproteobacteria bacterium]MCD8569964.1 hypothetical protein [Alphaproteobacteria bacterium]
MSRVITLQKHKSVPSDHFGRAAALVEKAAVLLYLPPIHEKDPLDGYRMDAINKTFETGSRPFGVNGEEMFFAIYTLMKQVQAETADRQVSEARDRLLAIATGLSDEALDVIRRLELDTYRGDMPPDAVLRFICFADDKRRIMKKRFDFDSQAQHEADIIEFPAI